MFEYFKIDRASYDGPVLVTGAAAASAAGRSRCSSRAGVPAAAFDLSEDKRRPRLLMSDDRARQGRAG